MVKDHINPNITFLGEKNVTGSSKNANIKRKNKNFEKQKMRFFFLS